MIKKRRTRRLASSSLAAATIAIVLLAPSLAGAQTTANATESAGIRSAPLPIFVDVADRWGIDFQQRSAPEKKYIVESMSGGVALVDIDNDGLLDIYLVNSLTVDSAKNPQAASSALFHNRGSGKFERLPDTAGVDYPGWGVGVCVGDADGDGHDDIYVTGVEQSRLFRNRGDLSFEDATKSSGVSVNGWSTGCGFADPDRDGDLDLFVSRYVEIDLDDLPEFGKDKTCQYRGVSVQCGPRGLPGLSDVFYRNRGDGTFEDAGKEVGILDADGYFGLGIAWFDANDDGWIDLYVANDATPNFLFLNQKNGTFLEEAFPMGVAVSEDGGEQGGMGVAVGDLGNRAKLDLFVSNFAEEYNAVYQNKIDFLVDISFASGSGAASLPYVGWGSAFLDADNDTWLDLLVVNGHVYPQLDRSKLGASAPYRQRRLFYRNQGGKLTEVGEQMGPAFNVPRVSRGLAIGDLDNDGRQDVVINDLDGKAQVLHNRSAASNWLTVILQQPGPNHRALGAKVTATWTSKTAGSDTEAKKDAAGTSQTSSARIVQSGTSYLSQSDFRVHFGLGQATQVDRLVVRWPDGEETVHENLAANQFFELDRSQTSASATIPRGGS